VRVGQDLCCVCCGSVGWALICGSGLGSERVGLGVVAVQFGKGEYDALGMSGRDGRDDWFNRRGTWREFDFLRGRGLSGVLKEDRLEDAKLRLHGEGLGSRRGDLYASTRKGGADSLTGVQYRSHVSFSSRNEARSAFEGLRVRDSSNEVSDSDELNGSYIMPGSELSDDMDSRCWSFLDVAWHAFVRRSSVVGLR
jgi:hypothetical protein